MKNKENVFNELFNGTTYLWPGTYMIRMNVLDKLYPDREIYPSRNGQNMQLVMMAAYVSKAGFIDIPLMKYVLQKESLSHFSSGNVMQKELNAMEGYKDIRKHLVKQFMNEDDQDKWNDKIDKLYANIYLDIALKHKDKDFAKSCYENIKHRVMNEQEPHPGLGSVLKKEVPLSEAITNVKLPKERTNENGSLHVIFGGAPDGENSLLIGSEHMRALIKALKSKYDIIILDTAPSELLADAPLLGKYVDAALYVIRYDYTKLREIREGVESLALSGIDMLGYVFNGDNSSGGQGYGYGYRRYGNYGSYGSHYGSYGKYGAYGHYGKMEKGSTDKFGRVIKD